MKDAQDQAVRSELLEIRDLAQAFVRDLDGTIQSWDNGVERLYGWTASEAVGRISHDLLRTEFPRTLAEIEADLLENKSWRGELCQSTKDGRRITVMSHWALYRKEACRPFGVIEISNDISELRETQRELALLRKENEIRVQELEAACDTAKRLSAIVESSNDAIIGETLHGVITSWNGGAQRTFGYQAHEVIGKSVSVLAAPERTNELPEIMARVCRGEIVKSYETVRRHKDGRRIDVSLTVSPIFNAQGKIEGASKTARDITEKKQAERLLLSTNEELRQFAYAAAHDLQEPIRDISLYAQMITKHCSGCLDELSQTYIDIVLNGATRMRTLVGDLLAYTKATSDFGPIHPSSGASALATATEKLRTEIAHVNASISATEPLPSVLMHPAQLTTIFQHLLANALKYSGARTPAIHVSAERNGREHIFSVRDNGIGIEQQHWTRIFGVFKRLHGREIPGTGIGLALCHRIVNHYGGRIWVRSVVGQGSMFYFTVPAVD